MTTADQIKAFWKLKRVNLLRYGIMWAVFFGAVGVWFFTASSPEMASASILLVPVVFIGLALYEGAQSYRNAPAQEQKYPSIALLAVDGFWLALVPTVLLTLWTFAFGISLFKLVIAIVSVVMTIATFTALNMVGLAIGRAFARYRAR